VHSTSCLVVSLKRQVKFVQDSDFAALAVKVERGEEDIKDIKGSLARIETTLLAIQNSQAKLENKTDVGLAKLDTKVDNLEGSYRSLNMYIMGIYVLLIGSVTIHILLLALGYVMERRGIMIMRTNQHGTGVMIV